MKSYTTKRHMLAIFENYVDRYARESEFKSDEGVYFIVKIEADNHGYEKDGNTHHPKWECHLKKYFHVIILSQRMVFVYESDVSSMPAANLWVNTSNHCSCFREGFDKLTDIGFKAWDFVHKNTPKKHRPDNKDEHIEFSFGTFCTSVPFKCVKVTHHALERNCGYHRVIEKIDIIKKQITV